jgi:hypothetical protein
VDVNTKRQSGVKTSGAPSSVRTLNYAQPTTTAGDGAFMCPPFVACGIALSVASPFAAFTLFAWAVHDEPFMVWNVETFAMYVSLPMVIAIGWAFWLARLVTRHGPPQWSGRAALWVMSIVWVLLNFGLLALAPIPYLEDMWRMADFVYVP